MKNQLATEKEILNEEILELLVSISGGVGGFLIALT